MTFLPGSRLRLAAVLLPLVLAAGCFADDSAPASDGVAPPPDPAPAVDTTTDATADNAADDAADTDANPAASAPVLPATPFQNDLALESRLDPDALGIPGRFVRIYLDDREPILSLGLVGAAARLTYAVSASYEVLSLDLLRLHPGVDPEAFFLAFAATVADTPGYRGLDTVGVPRSVGDSARHFAFTIDEDEADAVVLLRDDLLAFVTYRRPPNLRSPIDIAALMRAVDAALQAPPRG